MAGQVRVIRLKTRLISATVSGIRLPPYTRSPQMAQAVPRFAQITNYGCPTRC
jgi:hypothetical protein